VAFASIIPHQGGGGGDSICLFFQSQIFVALLSLHSFWTRFDTMMKFNSFDPSRVIIFDWDDTICPSSFVDQCNIENVSELSDKVRFSVFFSQDQHLG
jgi:hypothetical protein